MTDRTCAVEGCPIGGRLKRGWCPTHYARWMRTGNPGTAEIFEFGKPRPRKVCAIVGCSRLHKARGLCRTHYSRWQTLGDPQESIPIPEPLPGGTCSVGDCWKPISVKVRRLCATHYDRWNRTGSLELRPRATLAPEERQRRQTESRRRSHNRLKLSGRTCLIDACHAVPVARGWCGAHYRRWRLHGDPRASAPVRQARSARPCGVPGCGDLAQTAGYCCRHYNRYRKYGDPLGGGPFIKRSKWVPRSASMEDRFWVKVEKTDACWLWLGALNDDGYGLFVVKNGKPRKFAHRVSWELAGNTLLPGLEIDHRCRVRHCVRPGHLRQVTHAVNSAHSRRSHCARGHPFDDANTFYSRDGKGRTRRGCRACYNAWRRRRRASKRVSRADSAVAWSYRLAIANDPCRYCGGAAEHIEHYYPTAKGGRDFWWNLTRACGPCNRSKGSRCGTWFRLYRGSEVAAMA